MVGCKTFKVYLIMRGEYYVYIICNSQKQYEETKG